MIAMTTSNSMSVKPPDDAHGAGRSTTGRLNELFIFGFEGAQPDVTPRCPLRDEIANGTAGR
jgi:hypothetical protein